MRKSKIPIVPLLSLVYGCSLFAAAPPAPPPRAVYLGRTATLDITNGLSVVASTELPRGFIPNPNAAPMWLAQDLGIAIDGSLNGKAMVIGLRGRKLADVTVIARDFGPGAPAGRILDVAASPDGMELAVAVAEPANNRLNLMLIDSISGGEGHSVASFDGDYRVASMNWIDRDTLAVVIHQSTAPTQIAANVDAIGPSSGGLYVIGIAGLGSVTHFDKIPCRLTRLSLSPSRRFAVSAGDRETPPAVVDLRNQTCSEIHADTSIKVLGWTPDSAEFLYAAKSSAGSVSTLRFNMATGRSTLVAVSSAAVAYASDGTIVAMGNGGLSWKRIAQDPNTPIKAEIALVNYESGRITINSLGFRTPPAMFAQSAMVFTTATDSAAIDTFVPLRDGLLRELIDYSYPARSAFVLASGAARGSLSMRWSPDGRALAMVDGDASLAMLTVMIPPR